MKKTFACSVPSVVSAVSTRNFEAQVLSIIGKHNKDGQARRVYPQETIERLKALGCTVRYIAPWDWKHETITANGLWLATLTRYYDGGRIWAFQTIEDGENWDNNSYRPDGCPPSKKKQHEARNDLRASRRIKLKYLMALKAIRKKLEWEEGAKSIEGSRRTPQWKRDIM